MAMLDDDASRTTRPQLDDPEPSDDTAKDDEIAAKLGYSKYMIEDVRIAGR